MKRASMLATACIVLGALALSAAANASYNSPKEAKKINIGLVTAHNQCVAPTLAHRPSLANPGCPPVQTSANNPANVYSFAPTGTYRSGSASVRLDTTNGNVKLNVKSSRILKNGTLFTGTSLVGTAILRITDNGCGAAFDVDCTLVDFPFPVGLTCTNGSCKSIAPTANAVLPNAVHAGDSANIDVGQITVSDEDGDPFVRSGLLVGRSFKAAAFNAPRESDRVETAFVPAYNQCPGGPLTHRPALALPACAPAQSSANNPANTYTFGQSNGNDAGFARIVLRRAPHRDDVRMHMTSRHIWKNGSDYTGSDLLMTAVIRATDEDCGPSYDIACTQTDIPFPVGLNCNSGTCTTAAPSWNALLPGSVHIDNTASFEIGQISIRDEDGDTFARSGLFVE